MLFCIAMDYLPIQASAVPCEHVFSSSLETMTKCCNRISPILMEALQMTKYFVNKRELDFTKGWVMSQKDMQQDIEDEDRLASIIDSHLSKEEVVQMIDDIMVAIADDECD